MSSPMRARPASRTSRSTSRIFRGTFPARPVMPGVLIIEAMAQTAAVLVVHTLGPQAEGKLVYFMTRRQRALPPAGIPRRRSACSRHQAAQSRQCLEIRGPRRGGRPADGRSRLRRDDPGRLAGSAMARVHPTAIIAAGATLAEDVVVGPYCIVGPDVVLASGVSLRAHVVDRRTDDDWRTDPDLSVRRHRASSRRILNTVASRHRW